MTVAILGTAVKPARMPRALEPTRIATSATPIGRPMATTEPKATARTTAATRMATISPPPPAGALA